MHLQLCVEIYREQLKHGCYFLHEQLACAPSWQEEAMQRLAAKSVSELPAGEAEVPVLDQAEFTGSSRRVILI